MYILQLNYFKSADSTYPDECFELIYCKNHLHGDPVEFAKLYNLHEDYSCGELDYRRETNVEEVKQWIEDSVITYPMDSKKFEEIVLSNPSARLEIMAFYWQSGFD